jgi:integrase
VPGQIINRTTDKSRPTYLVRVPLGRDASGTRTYLSKTIHGTKKDAELFLADQLKRRDMGADLAQASNPATMEQLFADTSEDSKLKGRSTRWIEEKTRLHLLPAFGNKQARNVTTQDIRSYVLQRQRSGASNATINRELSLLKRTFRLAMRATPPKLSAMPNITKLAEDNARQGFLTPDEFQRLRNAITSHSLQALVTIAYETGMRRGELLHLKHRSVDLEYRELRLTAANTKNKTARIIPLSTEAAMLLTFVVNHPDHDEYVFVNERRQPYTNLNPAWNAACKEAGLWDEKAKKPTKLFHDLRRTAVRNFVRRGVAERVAMAISGHKTRSIFDRYNIVSGEDLHAAMDKVSVLPEKLVPQTVVDSIQ